MGRSVKNYAMLFMDDSKGEILNNHTDKINTLSSRKYS